MRLLLPMACTIVFVMKSASYTDGKPSNPNDNYTYRLLEVDLEPPEREEHKTRQSSKARPSNDDYLDSSYQQSIIPKLTPSPSYSSHNDDYDQENEKDDDDDQSDPTQAPVKKPNNKRTPRNGKIIVNAEIPPDFQREISQLRIPRRVNKKKKSKSPLKKRKKTADEDTDTGMDLDMDMDVTVDMDLGLGEEFNARYDNDNKNSNDNSNNDDQEHEDSNDHNKTYKKDGKRRIRRKGKGKGKGKGKRKRKPKSSSKENDDSNKNPNTQGDDEDEANPQEEEEEVEEKKEKTHKLIIKKRRPFVNSTKPALASASASGAKQGTPISHTHVHSYSGPSYQSLIGKKPGWGNSNKQIATGGDAGGKRPQKHHHQQQQQLQVVKPVKPLTLQENAAVEVLNANHQEVAGGVPKGIKPRDVNLILRTKNSPRILIRRYKPLFGAYPVSLNLLGGGRRKILYRRPIKGRKKACKKCKKKQRNEHKFFNRYPALASDDVEMVHPSDLGNFNQAAAAAVPTTCAHTADHMSPLSPLQMTPFSGNKYPWYEDGNGAGVGLGSPSSYFPHNKFEYADENVISPRLPSQPVNAYIQMPLLAPPQTPSLSPPPPVYGSGRSSKSDDDNANVNNIYESSPSDANTNSAIVTPTRQQEDQENKSDDDGKGRKRQRKQPQQQQDSGEESFPVYQVHETEYEPVTGHANVEELAAVHQQETDASLFADERQPAKLHLQLHADAENEGDSNDALATVEEADDGEEDQEERPHRQRQSHQDDDELGDAAGDQEGQVEEDEDDEEGAGVDERKPESNQQQQQYVDDENENQPSDDVFDFSNADAWTEEMVETDT